MVRIGLLGCGRIGRMHADHVAKHASTELVMVYDAHQPSAESVGEAFGARIAKSAEDMFANAQVDAILIASSTPTHCDFIEKSVYAGKAVMCEKPIDLSLERVLRCEKTISAHDVPVQIGFNRRFDPGHRRARAIAHSGEIGDLHQVIITSRDPEMPPRAYYESAGGLLRDMTIHDFDLARYLLNDEPVEVFATVNRLIDPKLMTDLDDYDTAMIIMRTADGKQCHINNSRSAVYGYDQRLELLGHKGMVQSGNRAPDAVRSYTQSGVEIAHPYQFFFIERYRESFIAELESFVRCIEQGTTPESTYADGRQALVLAEAAYISIREKRMVRVDEIT